MPELYGVVCYTCIHDNTGQEVQNGEKKENTRICNQTEHKMPRGEMPSGKRTNRFSCPETRAVDPKKIPVRKVTEDRYS